MKKAKTKDKWLALISDIMKKSQKTKDNKQIKKWPEESLSYKKQQKDVYLNRQ